MITKTNKFLLELFNVPSTTTSEDLNIQHDCIASWSLQKIEAKGDEYVAYIETIMRETIASDSLDGELSVSATNHEVQGVDLYIKPLEPIPMSLSISEDALAQSEGWALFDADGEIQLQRIDEIGVFSKDTDAHEFVKAGAASGSALHLKVKEILLAHSQKEHNIVFA